jgi:RNA polymerase sigma-70 factor (ECF subfamily)
MVECPLLEVNLLPCSEKYTRPLFHSTDRVLQAIRQGDEHTFEQLFNEYYPSLCHFANSYTKDLDEAEELVQAVFINLWDKRETLVISVSLKSYLYKAVYNSFLNQVKHRKIKEKYKNYTVNQTQGFSSEAADAIVYHELQHRIDQAINSLPDQCRHIFTLSRFENLKYSEIAEQIGVSVKMVEKQMGKALKVLRKRLAEYLPILIGIIRAIIEN